MLVEQIIELKLSDPGPPGHMCILQLVISMTKQKSIRNIFEWIILFTAKILQEAK